MRKAVQHKIFEIKNKKGLSTAISKMNKFDECIQKNVMENLDVMTSGPLPPNPSELLASENTVSYTHLDVYKRQVLRYIIIIFIFLQQYMECR